MPKEDGEALLPEEELQGPFTGPPDALTYHPVVALTTLQRRGSLTVPAILRQAMGLTDTMKCLMASQMDGTVILRPMPPAAVWFGRHDRIVTGSSAVTLSEEVPKRWLDTATLLRAQTYPDGPQRRWFVEGDQGFVTARVDPVVLAEWLECLPAILPSLDRRGIASYVQVVLSWTGVVLTERDVYWSALERWGQEADLTWPEAVRQCREEEVWSANSVRPS